MLTCIKCFYINVCREVKLQYQFSAKRWQVLLIEEGTTSEGNSTRIIQSRTFPKIDDRDNQG